MCDTEILKCINAITLLRHLALLQVVKIFKIRIKGKFSFTSNKLRVIQPRNCLCTTIMLCNVEQSYIMACVNDICYLLYTV